MNCIFAAPMLNFWNVLTTAQEKKLSILEMSTSYGAQGKVLFRDLEILAERVLPR